MARPRKNDETGSPWVVRDVPEITRRRVRVFAAEHDLTMAQAITALVDVALTGLGVPDIRAGESMRIAAHQAAAGEIDKLRWHDAHRASPSGPSVPVIQTLEDLATWAHAQQRLLGEEPDKQSSASIPPLVGYSPPTSSDSEKS